MLLTFERIPTITQKSTIDCRPMLEVTGITLRLEKVAQQSNAAVRFQLIMPGGPYGVSEKPFSHDTGVFQAEKLEEDTTSKTMKALIRLHSQILAS